MAAQKPSIPSGTRDFGPEQVQKRKYILNQIEEVFKLHGFMPLETPTMENLSTLEGKYGEEGDRLLYSIVESGDYFSETGQKVFRLTYYLVQFLRKTILYLFDENVPPYELIGKPKIKTKDELSEFLKANYIVLWKGRLIEALDRETNSNLDLISKDIDKLSGFIFPLFQNLESASKLNSEKINFLFDQFWTLEENKTNFENLYHLIGSNYNYKTVKKNIASKGMRYDLTVPFARYVVMNRNNITLPFKRYQMQPVWRADRPQKGRYREFWQCDADVVGSDSLLNEADLLLIYLEAFRKLGLEVVVRLNNRKILEGMATLHGERTRFVEFATIIDKMDKIGYQAVMDELHKAGFDMQSLTASEKIFSIHNDDFPNTYQNNVVLGALADLETEFEKRNIDFGIKGIEELKTVFNLIPEPLQKNVMIDPLLARGLSYYTGIICEVVSHEGSLKSSIGGGGRYDNLTGVFGMPGLSGVGISFGLDRIYDILEELKRFPESMNKVSGTKVLLCGMDSASQQFAFSLVQLIREAGIASEVYPDHKKLGKQLDFANALQIPFAVIIGESELKNGQLTLKDLTAGTQESLTIEEIIKKLS